MYIIINEIAPHFSNVDHAGLPACDHDTPARAVEAAEVFCSGFEAHKGQLL